MERSGRPEHAPGPPATPLGDCLRRRRGL